MTVRLVLQLAAVCALSACVAPTPPVATGPSNAAETEVYNLVLNVATDVAIARTIADDCPNLRFDEVAEDLEIAAIAGRANVLLGGDQRRGLAVVNRLNQLDERQIGEQIEPRLLAFIRARDYLPGTASTACRVGTEERRQNSVIGRLLIAG